MDSRDSRANIPLVPVLVAFGPLSVPFRGCPNALSPPVPSTVVSRLRLPPFFATQTPEHAILGKRVKPGVLATAWLTGGGLVFHHGKRFALALAESACEPRKRAENTDKDEDGKNPFSIRAICAIRGKKVLAKRADSHR